MLLIKRSIAKKNVGPMVIVVDLVLVYVRASEGREVYVVSWRYSLLEIALGVPVLSSRSHGTQKR